MPIMQWEDMDALCGGIYELLVLTYLQGQILFCADMSVFDESGLKISQKDSVEYLWERQRVCLQKINCLIEKEEFIVKDDAPLQPNPTP